MNTRECVAGDGAAVALHGKQSTLVLDLRGRLPTIVYWGKRLRHPWTMEQLAQLQFRQEAKCAAVLEPAISLSPNHGQGFTGQPGLLLSNSRDAWSCCGDMVAVTETQADGYHTVLISSEDPHRHIRLVHRIAIHINSDVVRLDSAVDNLTQAPLQVEWCAAPTVPLPPEQTHILAFSGRWSREFQAFTVPLDPSGFIRENRKGHTSHDNFPGFITMANGTNEAAGACFGFHLGWSGNHKMRVEALSDGRQYAQLGELLLPGEVQLQAGERYQSPQLFASFSASGLSQLSHQFHTFARDELLSDQLKNTPRPVHYNTWEGIYFEHDEDALSALAERAAALGAERFVLDDGWFVGRHNDRAGLGDWVVDSAIYPNGLGPLISKVNGLGMEFGIWFEPEMVNPDSDLFRAHPDWVLGSRGNTQLQFRHQLVLDLTRPEVTSYLFERIHALLLAHPQITYIKWDMNRDINHPGDGGGKPAIHCQTKALYALLAKIKKHHPRLELETCSSGGGRIDYGILQYADRVWTSDSNDALDRLSIQRGASFFIPTELLGTHVGPLDCHITGRRISMDMRAAVALFGHMGFELDPRHLPATEERSLRAALALYKQYRSLIHSGQLIRLQGGSAANANYINFAVVNADRSRGLYAINVVSESDHYLPPSVQFTGLDIGKRYRLQRVWPQVVEEYSPSVLSKIEGQIYSGELLVAVGVQLPLLPPQSSLIFLLTCIQ